MNRLSNTSFQLKGGSQVKPPVKLPFCLFDKKDIINISSGLRPYRSKGVRMQKQEIKNKSIYHNYGHGGGGISVGYGCAEYVINNFFKKEKVKLDQEIAVLGAGIIGISTAYLLAQMGYKVNLYAQLYPFKREEGKPQITTTVAAGYWMPLKIGDKQKTKQMAINTWKHYLSVMQKQQKSGKQYGITKMPTYCINDDEGLTYFPIEDVIEPKKTNVTFGDGIIHEAIVFQSLVIESSKYLPYIMQLIEKTGKIKYFTKKFNKEDIKNLKQKHVFNCCGLGSKELFADKSQNKGLKGHVIAFDIKNYKNAFNHILFMKTKQGRWILQVPHNQSQKICLGISYEQNKSNAFIEQDQVQKVFSTAYNYFKQVQIKVKELSLSKQAVNKNNKQQNISILSKKIIQKERYKSK